MRSSGSKSSELPPYVCKYKCRSHTPKSGEMFTNLEGKIWSPPSTSSVCYTCWFPSAIVLIVSFKLNNTRIFFSSSLFGIRHVTVQRASSIFKTYQRSEDRSYSEIHSRYMQQCSSHVWAGIVVCGNPPRFAISVYRQSYRHLILHDLLKLLESLPQWDQIRDACLMVLQHTVAVLCEMISVTRGLTDGQVEENPSHGFHPR
jgi:hypothetical protein